MKKFAIEKVNDQIQLSFCVYGSDVHGPARGLSFSTVGL
jgi:hypothetical protein